MSENQPDPVEEVPQQPAPEEGPALPPTPEDPNR